MLNIFTLDQGRLVKIQQQDIVTRHPIWVDVIAPSEAECEWIQLSFAMVLPQPEHLRDIEASARFYEEHGELHLRSDFLLSKESGSRSVIVAFVLAHNILFSVHDEDLPVFTTFRQHASGHPEPIENSLDVLIDLYESDIEFSADALEDIYADLGRVSSTILKPALGDKKAATVLAKVAEGEHLNGRIRRNLMDTRRAISFLMRSNLLKPNQLEEAKLAMQDIESLDGHTAFLFDKINFLMNTTVGFISINQNKIVRLFSVASVGLLPPTLIASIYGMNFKFMPELDWQYGYLFALMLMIASVAIPFWIFQRKGWLK
jgi:magnesium transporter